MSRSCPVCSSYNRELLFSSPFKVPDGWPLPDLISWYRCLKCGLMYGDGNFDQEMLNEYYVKYYGYGINSQDVKDRLIGIADSIVEKYPNGCRVVDFGGSGDDGRSIIVDRLQGKGWKDVTCVNAGDPIPVCDVLVASHVLEHVYDMPAVMNSICDAIALDGLLIVDGPDATGLLQYWKMPMLDFNTKHIIHFRMLDYLQLMDRYGFTLVNDMRYEDVRSSQTAPCFRLTFQRLDMAYSSMQRVTHNMAEKLEKLNTIKEPVNVWGLGDITWYLLSQCNLNVLDYIDNDPAMRGHTYNGKLIQERPTNDAPIIILAQGQREKLIENIRKAGVTNEIISL